MDTRRWWLGVVAVACLASCGGKGLKIVGTRGPGEAGAGNESGSGGSDNIGGSGGSGGSNNIGGSSGSGGGGAEAGTVFHESSTEVKALTADATTLYWIEYGTRDDLGNYQNDGRLLARRFDSEQAQVLADDLEGPIGVAVTTEQAFVYLDQVQVSARRNALARLPLGGGAHEVVMLDVAPDGTTKGGSSCQQCLVHDGAAAYFPAKDGVYMIAPEASEPSQVLDFAPHAFTIAAGTLYVSGNDGIWKLPPGSDELELLWADATVTLQATTDYLYSLDAFSGLYLIRMPIEGGPWMRLPPKHKGGGRRLQIVDELFFHPIQDGNGPWQIAQGTLADTAGVQVVVELPLEPFPVWVGTRAGVFWIDGGKQIRTAPLAVE